MTAFDSHSSQTARAAFDKARTTALTLSANHFAAFLAPSPLQFYQTTTAAELVDTDGARAEIEVFADTANGLYRATIATHIGDSTLSSQLYAHEIGDSGSYRIDKLVVDNEIIDMNDTDAASAALMTFLAYKNAGLPSGLGPAVLFPRPDGATLPSKATPSMDTRRKGLPATR